MKAKDWPDQVYETLKGAGVRQVGYVPDAGHKRLIELCRADKQLKSVVLSTEEEGIGLAAGESGCRAVLVARRGGRASGSVGGATLGGMDLDRCRYRAFPTGGRRLAPVVLDTQGRAADGFLGGLVARKRVRGRDRERRPVRRLRISPCAQPLRGGVLPAVPPLTAR